MNLKMLLRGDNIQNRSQAGGESHNFPRQMERVWQRRAGRRKYGGTAFTCWFVPSVLLDLTFGSSSVRDGHHAAVTFERSLHCVVLTVLCNLYLLSRVLHGKYWT